MSGPMLWVDDVRDPPEPGWTVARTSDAAIAQLDRYRWHVMSLGEDKSGREVLRWLVQGGAAYWPDEVRVHVEHPLQCGLLTELVGRYHPNRGAA